MSRLMSAETSLSDFWRYDLSQDRVQELVSILHGADILIGNMGSDMRATWSGSGVSFTDCQQRIVALDYGPLRGQECPFPGTAVDEVIGYAVHEGGHCLWSAAGRNMAIKRRVLARWGSLPLRLQEEWQAKEPLVLAELGRIQNVLEDAYIDNRIARRWPVLKEYINIARKRLDERTPIDLAAIAQASHPDRNAVINLWVSLSLYDHTMPSTCSPPVIEAVHALLDLSQKAAAVEYPVVRQNMAVDAAAILWERFPARTSPLSPLSEDVEVSLRGGEEDSDQSRQTNEPQGDDSRSASCRADKVGNLDDFDPVSDAGQGGREVVPVPSGLLKAVAEAITREVEDLSQSAAQVLAEDPRQVAAGVKKADYDPGLARAMIAEVQPQVSQVQQAFRHQQDLKTRWLRGLERGRLDDRRLWKPFVGGTGYYKRKDLLGRPSLAVGLLLDVSGSMGEFSPLLHQTAALFFQGLVQKPGINFAAWCYTGQSTQVVLTRICDRQSPRLCLANIEHGGGTPSGTAIAGVKALMQRMQQKRKLLVHFTDGQPHSAVHVTRAVMACRNAGIQVYAIGLPQHRDTLCSQYGEGNFETIHDVSELPEAVARIVNKLSELQRWEGPHGQYAG